MFQKLKIKKVALVVAGLSLFQVLDMHAGAKPLVSFPLDLKSGTKERNEGSLKVTAEYRYFERSSLGQPGKVGRSAHFTGAGFIELDKSKELSLEFPFTISSWVMLESFPEKGLDYTILSQWHSSSKRSYKLTIDEWKKFRFTLSPDGVETEAIAAGKKLSESDLNKWIHVVITVNADGEYQFYVNGKKSGNGVLKSNKIYNSSVRTMIGAIKSGYSPNDRRFQGKIDQVMIFDQELLEADVKELYSDN